MILVIQYGSPVVMVALLCFFGSINSKLKDIVQDVQEIKTGITWGDTCRSQHRDIDRRLGALERKTGLNGNAETATN